jgi:cytochrome c biogenesis protein CcmG/thiol:disulfide interchange protein DsbE
MRSQFEWTVLILAVVVLGGAWTLVSRVPPEAANPGNLPPAPQVGHPAPDFSLRTTEGVTITLSALRGRPVMINFWATWCPPCRAEIPHIQDASVRYAGEIVFLGVDSAEPAPIVADFAARYSLTYPLPLDVDGKVSALYQVYALPTTFFVDRAGVIRSIFSGPMTAAVLEERLQQVLKD